MTQSVRRRLVPIAALALALCALPATGCAKKATAADTAAARLAQATKVLHAVTQVGLVLEQVQIAEQALFAAGDVPAAVHADVQKAFHTTADAVLTASNALAVATETTDPKALVEAVSAGLKSLSASLGHLNAKQSAQLAGRLNAAAALVELAVS